MGNASTDAFKDYLAAHVDHTKDLVSAALIAQGKKLADAVNAAAPKGKTGRLEHSGAADFAGGAGDTTDFRTGQTVSIAQAFGSTDFSKVVVTAGGPTTTKAEKHGKTSRYDYALATEFGTRHERSRPFFYPTFDRIKAGIERALADAFGESENAWKAGYGPQVKSGK